MKNKFPFIKGSRRNVLLIAISSLLIVIIFLVIVASQETSEAAVEEDLTYVRKVSVIKTQPATHASAVRGFAEVKPLWDTAIRAQVDGQILSISPDFQPGTAVRSGQILAIIDSTYWISNLAEARNRLANAELVLLQAKMEAEDAKRSWQESGLEGEPVSGLVLHEPQIKSAESEVKAAQAACLFAETQLKRTRIVAPFDGIITSRNVSMGQSVITGEVLLEIFSIDNFEASVKISMSQWQNLPLQLIGQKATLHEVGGSAIWQAKIERFSSRIDSLTRMRTLYLRTDNPLKQLPPLLPGSFVEIRIPGKQLDELLELPEGVLTRRGKIWYIDENDKLQNFAAKPVFTKTGYIYVKQPFFSDEWQIVRYPLESFKIGLSVSPVEIIANIEQEG